MVGGVGGGWSIHGVIMIVDVVGGTWLPGHGITAYKIQVKSVPHGSDDGMARRHTV